MSRMIITRRMSKAIPFFLIGVFISSIFHISKGQCDEVFISKIPSAGTMIGLSPAYVPVTMKGMKIHPENPFLFDFILETGKSGLKVSSIEFKRESQKLIKYFLASLTIKEDDLWVNLSPYEKDKIIPDKLGKTELGRDMLLQDYILKQLTASLIYPEKELGKSFWEKVYVKAYQLYGIKDISINNFNKVWIVADKAKVLERNDVVFVVGSHLKVILEEDYVASQIQRVVHHGNMSVKDVKASMVASEVVRELIIPAIENEVNHGQNFAQLRQMFNCMIIATWYKIAYKEALLNRVYSNKGKIGGVLNADLNVKDKIYKQYMNAYKKGVFNFIKEDTDVFSKQLVLRKYFSGGLAPNFGIQKVLERVTMHSPSDDIINAGNWVMVMINVVRGLNNLTLLNNKDMAMRVHSVNDLESAVVEKKVKLGLSAFVWTVNAQRCQSYVIVDEGLESTFRLDRETNTLYGQDGKVISFQQQRSVVSYVKNLKRRFEEHHSNLEIVALTSNENIFYNKSIVTVVRDKNGKYRVYRSLHENINAGRDYPMYVVFADGKGAIEPFVRFELDSDPRYVKVFINGKLRDDIRWATGMQLIMNDAEFTPPNANNHLAYFFDDPKHLFVMPKIAIAGYMSGGVFFMADQIVREPERINKYFTSPNMPQEFSLSYSEINTKGKKQVFWIQPDVAEALLKSVGYEKNDYSFRRGENGKYILSIRLKENGYPFHIIAETKDHKIKEIVMRGESGGYGASGATIREVVRWLKKEVVLRAGIIDQGLTVQMTIGKKTFVRQILEPNKDEQRASSIIVYTMPRNITLDNAMLKIENLNKTNFSPGGINLTANHLGLDVSQEGKGVAMRLDPAMVAKFQNGDFFGVEGVIIRIVSIHSLQSFLRNSLK